MQGMKLEDKEEPKGERQSEGNADPNKSFCDATSGSVVGFEERGQRGNAAAVTFI